MMLTRIDHIDLKVPDLAGTVDFLTTLGLEVLRMTDPARGSVELALPGQGQIVFELREDCTVSGTTLNHVAFSTSDAVADVRKFESLGLPITKAHAHIQHSGRTISNITDPGGTTWQLTD
ncbi:VOC family protein [Arthrobacter nitrophenolicus]|nr:VOC family protein [Arthrobacter nitrophenolicus]